MISNEQDPELMEGQVPVIAIVLLVLIAAVVFGVLAAGLCSFAARF